MTKSLNDWAKEAHELAVSKGFYENRPADNTLWYAARLALIHGELSEALEEVRKGQIDWYYCDPETGCLREVPGFSCNHAGEAKPEGFAAELADVFLRLVDLAHDAGIDFEDIVTRKHEYNKTRPHKHGGKVL